jgi:hypothetical protein
VGILNEVHGIKAITCWGMSDWGSLGNMDNSLGSVRNLAGGGITWGMIQYEMHAYEYVQYDACSMLTLGISQWYVGLYSNLYFFSSHFA